MTNGFSVVALVALLLGALPSLPGFLVQVQILPQSSVPTGLANLYHYAWFIGFALGFSIYLLLRKAFPKS